MLLLQIRQILVCNTLCICTSVRHEFYCSLFISTSKMHGNSHVVFARCRVVDIKFKPFKLVDEQRLQSYHTTTDEFKHEFIQVVLKSGHTQTKIRIWLPSALYSRCSRIESSLNIEAILVRPKSIQCWLVSHRISENGVLIVRNRPSLPENSDNKIVPVRAQCGPYRDSVSTCTFLSSRTIFCSV